MKKLIYTFFVFHIVYFSFAQDTILQINVPSIYLVNEEGDIRYGSTVLKSYKVEKYMKKYGQDAAAMQYAEGLKNFRSGQNLITNGIVCVSVGIMFIISRVIQPTPSPQHPATPQIDPVIAVFGAIGPPIALLGTAGIVIGKVQQRKAKNKMNESILFYNSSISK